MAKALIAIAVGMAIGFALKDGWKPSGRPSTAVLATVAPSANRTSSVEQSPPFAEDLLEIKEQVRAQAELLERQARLLDELTGAQRSQVEAQLNDCEHTQERLRNQLEGCLFAKADLERSSPTKTNPTPAPGSIRVEETIDRPTLPVSPPPTPRN